VRCPLVAILPCVLASFFASGCDGDSSPAGRRTLLDERQGVYRHIAIGDPESKVRARFGTPDRAHRHGECDLCPAGTTIEDALGQPTAIDGLPGEATEHTLRYRNVVFLTARRRVYGFLVIDPSARTRRDVGIGDRLARAGSRYRELSCGLANEGSEYATFRYCAGRLGRLSLSFGEDPIRSITISTTRIAG
jgi:hypothetical protein